MRLKLPEPLGSEITSESLYLRRREFIKSAALFTGTAAAVGTGLQLLSNRPTGGGGPSLLGTPGEAPKVVRPRGPYDTDERATSYEDATTYNNFYEFGTGKE